MLKSILLSISGIVAVQSLTVDPTTRTFRDDQGRARIFHGTNVVVKGAPYLPIQDQFHPHLSLSDKDLDDMVDWGITLVRLGVMWESVEVAPRQYNLTYLDEVDKLVNRMGDRGIYTIVDAHQDLYSRKTCGEGMPTFYAQDLDHTCIDNIPGAIFSLFGRCKSMEAYGHRKDEKGLPNLEDCVKTSFINYYTSPEVSSSFEGLYQNKYGIQDRFIEYWDMVSRKFSSNKYVVGYDPINEPWPANFYRDFSLFYKQTKFDSEFLFPLLQRVHTAIRANDDKKIIFFEPAQFPDTFPFFGGMVANIGFEQTPGGSEYLNRESLNDHTYCCQAAGDMCDLGEPPLDKKNVCKAFHVKKVKTRSDDAQRLGVPLFFTEFGACANTESCYHEITGAAEEFDNHLASWAYWMFKGFGDFTTTGSLDEGMYDKDGNLQQYKILALQRSYLHAIQGTPTSMYFFADAEKNATFIANYNLDTSINAPTELFFNQEVYYPEGYKLSVLVNNAPSKTLTIDTTQKNYIKIMETNPEHNGKAASIVLTRKTTESHFEFIEKNVQVDYDIKENVDPNLSGFVYFKVKGIKNLGQKTFFEIQGANGQVFCHSTEDYHECFTHSHQAHSVTINVLQPGWLTNIFQATLKLNRLNGHTVTVNVQRAKVVSEQ